mmetsp:Transcript_42263/g.78651  ORF Transcript_42263/g.78651 Transcript_42263/m.78651 type:complete len:115 (-) Transcript_42263:103-447(-)
MAAPTIGHASKVSPEDDEFLRPDTPKPKPERTACFCVYDNESDPRACVWRSGKPFPSPNIATTLGKVIMVIVASVVIAAAVAAVVAVVGMGGAPGLAARKREPPDPSEPTCCGR